MLLGDLGGGVFKFCKCSVIGGFRVLGVGVCLIFFNWVYDTTIYTIYSYGYNKGG